MISFTTTCYKAKSSAKRNAIAQLKKAGIESGWDTIEIDLEDGKFYWGNPSDFIPKPADDGLLHVSAMAGACSLVWTIAERMLQETPGIKRKDILDACTKAGIAFYTARTQYQRYREAVRDAAASALRIQ